MSLVLLSYFPGSSSRQSMPCLDMARNRFVNKPVIVVRDICKPHTHRMYHALAVDRSPGPNPLGSGEQELAFSGAEAYHLFEV